jgi:hypothetical protein
VRTRPISNTLAVRETFEDSPSPRLYGNRCAASTVVHNSGEQMTVMRSAIVQDLDGLCVEPGQTFSVRLAGIVRANATARLPISFDVPTTATPGRYRFNVSLGNVEQTMAIDVQRRVSVRLTPSAIIVANAGPATHTTHHITVENTGNVAVSVSGTIAVPLDDSLIVCRSLRGGLGLLSEIEEHEVTVDRLIARAAKTAHDALASAVLGMRFIPDLDPILAGGTATVTVEVETPAKLDSRTRYTAAVPILDTFLAVTVLPSKIGTIVEDAAIERTPPARDPATRKK